VILNGNTNTNGANFSVLADSDGLNGGNIQMGAGAILNTGGGNITFAGGVAHKCGQRNQYCKQRIGNRHLFERRQRECRAGNISMTGTGMAGTSFGADGIYITSGSS